MLSKWIVMVTGVEWTMIVIRDLTFSEEDVHWMMNRLLES